MKKLLILTLCILLLTGCAETYDGSTEAVPVLTEHHVRHISPFTDNTMESRYTFAYDIYGNCVQTMEYDDGELVSVTKTRYDDRGNMISETRWDHSGWIPHIERRIKRTYDDQNRELTYTSYDMWGRKTSESTNTYDDEVHTTTYENSYGDQVIYYYDENGLLLHDISTGAAGTIETVYTYDAHGNRTGWTSTLNGEPQFRMESGYDDQNRQIWFKYYDETGIQLANTTYTYDDDAHTTTIKSEDGSIRIEYYHEDGRRSLIEDYNERGDLSMYQQYYYQDIRVPKKEE